MPLVGLLGHIGVASAASLASAYVSRPNSRARIVPHFLPPGLRDHAHDPAMAEYEPDPETYEHLGDDLPERTCREVPHHVDPILYARVPRHVDLGLAFMHGALAGTAFHSCVSTTPIAIASQVANLSSPILTSQLAPSAGAAFVGLTSGYIFDNVVCSNSETSKPTPVNALAIASWVSGMLFLQGFHPGVAFGCMFSSALSLAVSLAERKSEETWHPRDAALTARAWLLTIVAATFSPNIIPSTNAWTNPVAITCGIMGLVCLPTSGMLTGFLAPNIYYPLPSPISENEIRIRFVTRGRFPELIGSRIRLLQMLAGHDTDDLPLDTDESGRLVSPINMSRIFTRMNNVEIDVVVDGPHIELPPGAGQINVPKGYQTPKGSMFKARALYYGANHAEHKVDEKGIIVHLDEETEMTLGLLYELQEWATIHDGRIADAVPLPTMNTYVRGFNARAAHLLECIAILPRPAVGYQRWAGVSVGLCGGCMTFPAALEQNGTWLDFGPHGSITEDIWAGGSDECWTPTNRRAYRMRGCVREITPFNMSDAWGKFKRWGAGMRQSFLYYRSDNLPKMLFLYLTMISPVLLVSSLPGTVFVPLFKFPGFLAYAPRVSFALASMSTFEIWLRAWPGWEKVMYLHWYFFGAIPVSFISLSTLIAGVTTPSSDFFVVNKEMPEDSKKKKRKKRKEPTMEKAKIVELPDDFDGDKERLPEEEVEEGTAGE